jgi:hypothetical protein
MAICNIIAENDADFYRAFAYQTKSGIPIDLTGVTMLMKIRKHASDVSALLELTTETGELVITEPTTGNFTVYISQYNLVRLALGDYEHSLIMTINDLKTRIWSGTLTVNPGASR